MDPREIEERLAVQAAMEALEEERRIHRERQHVWNRWKWLVIALIALCNTVGMIAASVADTDDPAIAFFLAGLVILLAAPPFLAKYYPPPHHSMGWRLFEVYLEVLLVGIAVTGVLILLAALASIGLESLGGIINRGP